MWLKYFCCRLCYVKKEFFLWSMNHLTTFLSEMMTHFENTAVPFLRTDVDILRGYGSSLIYSLWVKSLMHLSSLQISPTSAASTLSDRSRFKKYFRTDPTFEIFAPAVLSLLEHYNWSRIVFLTQNENLFNNVSEAKWTGMARDECRCSHTVPWAKWIKLFFMYADSAISIHE